MRYQPLCLASVAMLVLCFAAGLASSAEVASESQVRFLTQVTVAESVRSDTYVSELLSLQQTNRMGVPDPLPAACDARLKTDAEISSMYTVALNAMTNDTAAVEQFAAAYGSQWVNFPEAAFVAHTKAGGIVNPSPAVPAVPAVPVDNNPSGGINDVSLPPWATMPRSLPPGMTMPNGDSITMPGQLTLPPLPPMTLPEGMTLPGGEPFPEPTIPKTLPGGEPFPEPTMPKTLPGGQPMPEPTIPKTLPGGEPMPEPTMPKTLPGGQPMPEPTIPNNLPFQTTLPPLPPGFPPFPFKAARAMHGKAGAPLPVALPVKQPVAVPATVAGQPWAARMQLLKHLVIWANWRTQFGADCVVRVNQLTTEPPTSTSAPVPSTAATTTVAPTAAPTAAPKFTAKVNATFSEATFKAEMVAYLQREGVSGVATSDITVVRSGDDVSFSFSGSNAGLATQKAETMPASEQQKMGMSSMSAPGNSNAAGSDDDGPGLVIIVVPVVLGVLVLGGVAVLVMRSRSNSSPSRVSVEPASGGGHLHEPMVAHQQQPKTANPMDRDNMDLL